MHRFVLRDQTQRQYLSVYPGMAICGMAEGLEPSLQASGSFIVGEALSANFFAFVSMLDTVAELLGGPIMAAAYQIRTPSNSPAGYSFLLSSVGPLLLYSVLFQSH